MKRVITMILCLAVFLLAGCFPQEGVMPTSIPVPEAGDEGSTVPSSAGVAFETIDQGIRSGIRDHRELVIRDYEGWQTLWEEHVVGQLSKSPFPPPVDFSQEMVIAFFLGEKPTAGYEVEIVEIAQLEGRLVVRVQVKSPPPGVALLQVLTQPFHIVRLFRHDLPVEFIMEPQRSSRARF